MKAIRIHGYGGPDVLRFEDIPVPEPAWGEVLVRVHAAGVNPSDAKVRAGAPFASKIEVPFPFVPGWDVSGVVEAVGEGAAGFRPGDAVYGMVNFPGRCGAYAEYVAAPEAHLAPLPEGLSHIHASAMPLAGLTAWQALFEAARLEEGQSVLVQGAAGGVGHLAVQMAKWKGASAVYGTALKRDEAYLRGIGLDRCIDYTSERFEDVVKDVDVVLDCVGGAVQERSFGVIRKGGILVTIMEPPSEELAEQFGVRAARIFVRPDNEGLGHMADLAEKGRLRPYIYALFPLEGADEAHRLVEAGRTRGKIVLACRGI